MLGAQVYNPTGVTFLIYRELQERFAAFRPVFLTAHGGRPCHCSILTLSPVTCSCRTLRGRSFRTSNLAREVAEQSAREALIEAVKTGDTAPDCIQVTDGEGREVVTVFLEDLLDG